MVVSTINSVLAPVIPGFDQFHPQLWATIDQEIQIADSAVYTLITEPESDPFAEDGNVWSFNYFFCNKKVKRILLFTCRAQTKGAAMLSQSSRAYDNGMELDEMSEGSNTADYYSAVYDEMEVE